VPQRRRTHQREWVGLLPWRIPAHDLVEYQSTIS
jgi:hypothetical protein